MNGMPLTVPECVTLDMLHVPESRAAEMSKPTTSHVENAVRQHISTQVKSLWRLANGAGLDREEFERVIGLEVQCIGLMDRDE